MANRVLGPCLEQGAEISAVSSAALKLFGIQASSGCQTVAKNFCSLKYRAILQYVGTC